MWKWLLDILAGAFGPRRDSSDGFDKLTTQLRSALNDLQDDLVAARRVASDALDDANEARHKLTECHRNKLNTELQLMDAIARIERLERESNSDG